jgi:hypothetical protein
VRVGAFFISLLIFFLTLSKIFIYDYNNTFEVVSTLFFSNYIVQNYEVFFFAFDPISLSFGLLTSFIFPIVILTA